MLYNVIPSYSHLANGGMVAVILSAEAPPTPFVAKLEGTSLIAVIARSQSEADAAIAPLGGLL